MARLLKCSKCGMILGTYPKYCDICGGEPMTTDENPRIVPVPKSAAARPAPPPPKPSRSPFAGMDNYFGSPFSGFNKTVKAPKSERERLIDLLSAGCTLVVVAVSAAIFATFYAKGIDTSKQYRKVDIATATGNRAPVEKNEDKKQVGYRELAPSCKGNELTFGTTVKFTLPDEWHFDGVRENAPNAACIFNEDGITGTISVLYNPELYGKTLTEDQYNTYAEQYFGKKLFSEGAEKNLGIEDMRTSEFENDLTEGSNKCTVHNRLFIGKEYIIIFKLTEKHENGEENALPPLYITNEEKKLITGMEISGEREDISEADASQAETQKQEQLAEDREFSLGELTFTVDENKWEVTADKDGSIVGMYRGENENYKGKAYFSFSSKAYSDGKEHGQNYSSQLAEAYEKEFSKDGASAFVSSEFSVGGVQAGNLVINGKDNVKTRMLIITLKNTEYDITFGGEGDVLYDLGDELSRLIDTVIISEQTN